MKTYWDDDIVPGDFLEHLEESGYNEPEDCICECGEITEGVAPWLHIHSGGLWLHYEWPCEACDAQSTEAMDITDIYARWGVRKLEKSL